MKCVLIGYGEIGRAVKRVYGGVHDISVYDPEVPEYDELPSRMDEYELLLVAIPFTQGFVFAVQNYQRTWGTKATLVFSTTAIGTCSQLDAVHCPVEGKHPDLAESIGATTRWLGGSNPHVYRFFDEARVGYRSLPLPEHTEFLKLRSTTVYGANIELARYSKSVCDDLGLRYEYCKEWDEWVNALYRDHFGMPQFTRPILSPPEGAKGGHCVTPNARILAKQYPNQIVSVVAEEE